MNRTTARLSLIMMTASLPVTTKHKLYRVSNCLETHSPKFQCETKAVWRKITMHFDTTFCCLIRINWPLLCLFRWMKNLLVASLIDPSMTWEETWAEIKKRRLCVSIDKNEIRQNLHGSVVKPPGSKLTNGKVAGSYVTLILSATSPLPRPRRLSLSLGGGGRWFGLVFFLSPFFFSKSLSIYGDAKSVQRNMRVVILFLNLITNKANN